MKHHITTVLSLGAASLFVASFSSASILLTDSFSYPDGALAGNGTWARGVNSPTSDNPSNYITVESGAVKFDWTTAAPINNVVRSLWDAADAVSGEIFAMFDFHVTAAPQSASDVRPGFLSFADSAGSQQRGFVGIQAGTAPDTFQLGVSPGSQVGNSFSFGSDLQLNTTYSVMFSYDSTTTSVKLWLDDALVLSASNNTSANDIRRVNLRMYNSAGDSGVTNLGIFQLDNLVVTTVPEPATYAALIGVLALGMVIRRRMRRR